MAPRKKTRLQLQQEERRRLLEEAELEARNRAERDQEEVCARAERDREESESEADLETPAYANGTTVMPSNLLENSTTLPPPPPPVDSTIVPSSAASDDEEPPVVRKSLRCKDASKIRYVKSIKTAELVNSTGQKQKILWSDFHDGPAKLKVQTRLVRDIGACIKSEVPMTATSYSELKDAEREKLYTYLLNYYDIAPEDLHIWKYIDEKAVLRYSDWKHKCHKGYKDDKTIIPIEFLHRNHEWKDLVKNEFENEDKKIICERKRLNRTKNPKPVNHHAGSRPIIHNAEVYKKAGHIAPLCAAAVDAYLPSTNGRERAENLKRKIEEIEKEQMEKDPENLQPLPVNDQVHLVETCYGRKGTEIRGLGSAIRGTPKRRGGSRINVTQQVDELRAEYEERLKSSEDRVKTVERQLQEMQAMMRALMPSQPGTSGSK